LRCARACARSRRSHMKRARAYKDGAGAGCARGRTWRSSRRGWTTRSNAGERRRYLNASG